jgi:hypothetical protein
VGRRQARVENNRITQPDEISAIEMVTSSSVSTPVFGSDDEIPAGEDPADAEPLDAEPPAADPDPGEAEPVDDAGVDAPLDRPATGDVVEAGTVVLLAGVGAGEAAETTTVPCMKLWTRQWYVKVPGVEKVKAKVAPLGWMQPLPPLGSQLAGLESKAGAVPSAVTLCGAGSMLVQVTVVLAEMLRGVGL